MNNNNFEKTDEILSGNSIQPPIAITKDDPFLTYSSEDTLAALHRELPRILAGLPKNNQTKKDPFLTYSSEDTQAAWNKRLPEIIEALQKKDKEKKNNEANNSK